MKVCFSTIIVMIFSQAVLGNILNNAAENANYALHCENPKTSAKIWFFWSGDGKNTTLWPNNELLSSLRKQEVSMGDFGYDSFNLDLSSQNKFIAISQSPRLTGKDWVWHNEEDKHGGLIVTYKAVYAGDYAWTPKRGTATFYFNPGECQLVKDPRQPRNNQF